MDVSSFARWDCLVARSKMTSEFFQPLFEVLESVYDLVEH